jgi:hypothetical protein
MALADLLGMIAPQTNATGFTVSRPDYAAGFVNTPSAAPAMPQAHQPSKLRNFLGALGDALMVGAGGKPLYHERMLQQHQQSALQGFLTNPDQAIAQLMQVDAPSAIDLYKAVHPASETPLELKLLQYLKEHPEDAASLHQVNVDLHPGLGAPFTMPEQGATIEQPGASAVPQVNDQAGYDALAPGAAYHAPGDPVGKVRYKQGGATAGPSRTFR